MTSRSDRRQAKHGFGANWIDLGSAARPSIFEVLGLLDRWSRQERIACAPAAAGILGKNVSLHQVIDVS